MGTINSAFNIISGALDADQAALGVIANNVANANTTGYTEETATFQENSPVTINGANFGDGVTETGAESMRDRVLEGRIDQQQQLESSSSARLTALNTMQSLFTPEERCELVASCATLGLFDRRPWQGRAGRVVGRAGGDHDRGSAQAQRLHFQARVLPPGDQRAFRSDTGRFLARSPPANLPGGNESLRPSLQSALAMSGQFRDSRHRQGAPSPARRSRQKREGRRSLSDARPGAWRQVDHG